MNDPYGLRDDEGNYLPHVRLAAQLYAAQGDDPHHVITDEERERFLALGADLIELDRLGEP